MRRPPAVGDDDRAIVGSALRAAGVLVERSTGKRCDGSPRARRRARWRDRYRCRRQSRAGWVLRSWCCPLRSAEWAGTLQQVSNQQVSNPRASTCAFSTRQALPELLHLRRSILDRQPGRGARAPGETEKQFALRDRGDAQGRYRRSHHALHHRRMLPEQMADRVGVEHVTGDRSHPCNPSSGSRSWLP
jgi:hypothetical protein